MVVEEGNRWVFLGALGVCILGGRKRGRREGKGRERKTTATRTG